MKLHQKVKDNLENKTDQYVKNANKGRKEVVFEPGDWLWLHMRQERFPNQRSSKLKPRGDGPFQIAEKINNNAYHLDLPGELNVSSTFNVTDLSPFIADELVLRSKPFEEEGNDENITAEPNQEEPDLTKPDIQSLQDNLTQPEEATDVPMPIVFKGPITRKRAKILQHKFNESMMLAFDCGQDKPSDEPADEYTSSLETEELSLKNDGPTEKIKPPSKDLWPFIPDQVHPNLLVITIEDQPV